jgi:hypothetical protein
MDRGLFYRPDRSANAAVQQRRRRRRINKSTCKKVFKKVGREKSTSLKQAVKPQEKVNSIIRPSSAYVRLFPP